MAPDSLRDTQAASLIENDEQRVAPDNALPVIISGKIGDEIAFTQIFQGWCTVACNFCRDVRVIPDDAKTLALILTNLHLG